MARLNASQTRKKRPMRRLAFGAVLALFALLVAVQTSPQIAAMFDPVRNAATDRLAGNKGPGLWARLTGAEAREKRIRELEAEVRELARYKAAALSMAERLEAYEEMLNLLGEPPQRGVTARVIAESNGPFSESMLANAGRAQGIEKGAVAINEAGLVGRVVSLGEYSSRILLVNDFASRVPVMGEVSGLRAMLYGGRDGMGTLKDMPERGEFIVGERVLTTGEGGAFPRGIVTGYVHRTGDNWRVEFAKDKARGGFIRLIPPRSIPVPTSEPDLEDPEEIQEESAEPVASAAQGVRQ